MKYATALVMLSFVYIITAQELSWYVEGIQFSGNEHIEQRELIPLMQLQPPGFFTRSEYSFSKLIDDISVIKRYYHKKGYPGASVMIAGVQRDTALQGVLISLRICEGIPTIVDSILFEGNTTFTDSALSVFIPLQKGVLLDSTAFELSSLIIKDSLANRGYILADVYRSYEFNQGGDSVTVLYEITEGPVMVRGALEIIGAEEVKRTVIEREITIQEGEILTAYEIDRSIRRLYKTGLFNNVLFEPMDTGPVFSEVETTTVPVLVQLEAADLYNLQAGGGYSTENGFYGTAELSYANLFSLGHRIAVSTALTLDISGGTIVYSSPWMFGLPLLTDLTAFIERQETSDFTGLFTGGHLSISTPFDMKNRFQAWVRVENTLWLHDTVSGQDISDGTRGNSVLLGAGYTRDQRNNLINAAIGFSGVVEGEIAVPWISWSDKFYRLKLDIRGYCSFFKSKMVLASALFAGYVKEYGSGKNVPLQELFRVGEGRVRPVRGYEDELVANQRDNRVGGKIALIINPFEMTFPIYRILEGALFADCGVIWQAPDHIQLSDLRWSAGPGLRLVDLPIGIVRLDYGIRLDRGLDFKGRIHFGIGAAF